MQTLQVSLSWSKSSTINNKLILAAEHKKHRESLSPEQKVQVMTIDAAAHKKQYELLPPEKKARLFLAAEMTWFWARFKQNRAQNPAIKEILAKYYRFVPQNRAELAPSLFQNYYYEFPYTWIFRYWFLYVECLWASLLHRHICWALKY